MSEIEPGPYWARRIKDEPGRRRKWTLVLVEDTSAWSVWEVGSDVVSDQGVWEFGPRLEPPEERIRIEYVGESGKHMSAFYENEAINPYKVGEQFFFEGEIVEVLSVNRAGRDLVVKLAPRQTKRPVSGRRLELPKESVDKPRTGG